LRAALAAIALAAVAIGALAWLGPRLAKSEAARAKIQAAAHDALGRELRFQDIDFGLLPPSLLVVEPVVAGETESDPPLARAERIALRVALWPLLRRKIEVTSLAIDGLALHLVRTKDGLVLPSASKQESEPRAPSEPEPSGAPAPALDIRKVSVRDGRMMVNLPSSVLFASGSAAVSHVDNSSA